MLIQTSSDALAWDELPMLALRVLNLSVEIKIHSIYRPRQGMARPQRHVHESLNIVPTIERFVIEAS
jgi:hypothetical protein